LEFLEQYPYRVLGAVLYVVGILGTVPYRDGILGEST
jgi:hypothetical protein